MEYRVNTPLRVLLVNNSEEEAQPIIKALENFGYAVKSQRVDTPEKLSAALKKQIWDIILSDSNIPHFNGQQILRASRKNNADIPVVFISENLSIDTAGELVQAGANSCIPKTELSKLIPIIKRELHNAELQKEYKSAGQQIISQARFPLEDPSPVLRVTKDGIIIFHNRASLPLLLTWQTTQSKPVPVEWQKLIEEAYKNGTPKIAETTHKDKVFLLNIVPIKDADYVNIYATDITKRKHTEAALRESEAKYRSLIENITDAVLLTNPKGDILSANPAAERLFGHSEKEICRLGRNGILDVTDPRLAKAQQERERTGKFTGELFFIKKDGSKFPTEITSTIFTDSEGNKRASMIIREITERKRMYDVLRESERRLKAAQTLGKIGSYEIDLATGELTWSDEMYELFDMDKTQRPLDFNEQNSIFSPEDRRTYQEAVQIVIQSGDIFRNDRTANLPNGRTVFLHSSISPIKDASGNVIKIFGVVQDITENKQAEEQVKLQAGLLDVETDAIYVHDLDRNFIYVNQATLDMYGYAREVLLNSKIDILALPQNASLIVSRITEVMEKQQYRFETLHRRKDGSEFPVEIQAQYFEWHGKKLILSTTRDITERKQAEVKIRESEENFRNSLDQSPLGIRIVTAITGKPLYTNQALLDMWGYSSIEEFESVEHRERYTPEGYAAYKERFAKRQRSEFVPAEYEVNIKRKDGALRCLSVYNKNVIWNGSPQQMVIYQDITERKAAEEKLVESEQRLKEAQSLGKIANYEVNAETLSVNWSKQMYELFERDKNLPPPTVDEIEKYFTPEEYKKFEQLRLTAINESKEAHGDVIANLLSGNKPVFYVSMQPVQNSEGKLTKIFGIIQDITERKQVEEELEQSYARLVTIQKGIISAIAATIEIRDPYTAGHQQQVARLARAIAAEEGLPEDTVNAVYTAGVIHDIGKIGIPADILSKPGKLSEVEFSLIKAHPQIGFDVLKNIEFPFPLAQWVLQHHERMNGSGYPYGLKGEEISREARILAVADVVESMVSHRPYRPSLGIGAALDEIKKGRGILYDAEAVAALLRLFEEKGFKLE